MWRRAWLGHQARRRVQGGRRCRAPGSWPSLGPSAPAATTSCFQHRSITACTDIAHSISTDRADRSRRVSSLRPASVRLRHRRAPTASASALNPSKGHPTNIAVRMEPPLRKQPSKTMETGIQFSIVWSDEHLLELRIEASGGVFSGRADVYAHLGTSREFAATLNGFPIKPNDVRIIETGTFDSEYAGASQQGRIRDDRVGHAGRRRRWSVPITQVARKAAAASTRGDFGLRDPWRSNQQCRCMP
jgi:hypothetical protein